MKKMEKKIEKKKRGKRGELTAMAKRLGVSRQRAWQIVKRKAGFCGLCGTEPLHLYATTCDKCGVKYRQMVRKRIGAKPWRKGTRGRPPKTAEGQ